MKTRVAWSISPPWRGLAGCAIFGWLAVLGHPMAWAQTDTATQSASERRQELRSMVRQPQGAPASASDKALEQRHLNAEERSQLRRQLARELPAHSATLADASRP